MGKMETVINVPVSENETAMETKPEREVVSLLVLHVKHADNPLVLGLTEVQTFVAAHSIMKKDADGRISLFSNEELRRNRDLKRPLNHNLYSIMQAAEMVHAAQVCGACLDFHPEEGDANPLWLENNMQVAVILARLGIDLKTGRSLSDDVLDIIYGCHWDPELVMDSRARTLAALPYTSHNPRAGMCQPKQVKKKLDKTIVGQDAAKEKLVAAVYEQELAARHNTLHKFDKDFIPMRSQHVLLYGKEGSGKTALLEKLAEATGRALVSFDITTMVPPGYPGHSVKEPVWELLRQCGGDTEKASRGIICLDRWDQLFGCGTDETMQPVYRQALLTELMQLMDGRDITFRDDDGEHKLNTGNILFVIGGEFANLDSIILERTTGKKRLAAEKKSIGFLRQNDGREEVTEAAGKADAVVAVSEATLPDLKKYGMPSEMLERLTVVCRVNEPDRNDLVNILAHSDRSPVQHYRKMLRMHNVSLQVTDEALEAAADKAMGQKMGARGLASVFGKVLSPVVLRLAGNRKRLTLRLKPECFTADKAPEILPQKNR